MSEEDPYNISQEGKETEDEEEDLGLSSDSVREDGFCVMSRTLKEK